MTLPPITVGIDEVGRGPVFGPVCMAAVARANHPLVKGVKDSKKFSSDKRRAAVAEQVQAHSVWTISMLPAAAINQFGIEACLQTLTHQMIAQMARTLSQAGWQRLDVVVDGDMIPDETIECDGVTVAVRSEVKADATIYEVSAASVIAKVARDRWVCEMAAEHPDWAPYGLASNKGYGTPQHAAALVKLGLTDHHRTQFCRSLMATYRSKHQARPALDSLLKQTLSQS